MLIFVFSRLLAWVFQVPDYVHYWPATSSAWFTYLLPSYSTFKALRQRPLNEQEIDKWASYWILVGVVVAFEYTAEWLLSWSVYHIKVYTSRPHDPFYRFPFYWEIKTLFLLFLSLPQFEARVNSLSSDVLLIPSFPPAPQGSTFIYKCYVEPYLIQNEADIDASIASARNETLQFLQSRLSTLWDILYSLLSRTPVTPKLSPSGLTPANGTHLAGQNALFQSVQGLWGAINPPSFLAAPAPGSGKPTMSRSASDTVASEKQAPLPAPPTASATVGYDVDETAKNWDVVGSWFMVHSHLDFWNLR
jgi:receptor expression-enhancing protein 1/2/3/4